SLRYTSPYRAARVNGAALPYPAQDNVPNGAVCHPTAVVVAVVVAISQTEQTSVRDLLVAAAAGYETCISTREFLGRPHYKIFHTTGTAGAIAAAVAAGRLLELSPE